MAESLRCRMKSPAKWSCKGCWYCCKKDSGRSVWRNWRGWGVLWSSSFWLDRIYWDSNKVLVCDSYELKDGWREEIDKTNSESDYDWTLLTDEMLNLEESHTEKDMDANEMEENDDPVDSVQDWDLPKRVLAFSSKKLLALLAKGLKTSVDGTFKSSCSLWTQPFIWMVKSKE